MKPIVSALGLLLLMTATAFARNTEGIVVNQWFSTDQTDDFTDEKQVAAAFGSVTEGLLLMVQCARDTVIVSLVPLEDNLQRVFLLTDERPEVRWRIARNEAVESNWLAQRSGRDQNTTLYGLGKEFAKQVLAEQGEIVIRISNITFRFPTEGASAPMKRVLDACKVK